MTDVLAGFARFVMNGNGVLSDAFGPRSWPSRRRTMFHNTSRTEIESNLETWIRRPSRHQSGRFLPMDAHLGIHLGRGLRLGGVGFGGGSGGRLRAAWEKGDWWRIGGSADCDGLRIHGGRASGNTAAASTKVPPSASAPGTTTEANS